MALTLAEQAVQDALNRDAGKTASTTTKTGAQRIAGASKRIAAREAAAAGREATQVGLRQAGKEAVKGGVRSAAGTVAKFVAKKAPLAGLLAELALPPEVGAGSEIPQALIGADITPPRRGGIPGIDTTISEQFGLRTRAPRTSRTPLAGTLPQTRGPILGGDSGADIAGFEQAQTDAGIFRPLDIGENFSVLRRPGRSPVFTNIGGEAALRAADVQVARGEGGEGLGFGQGDLAGGVSFTSPEGVTTTSADAFAQNRLEGIRGRIEATRLAGRASELGQADRAAVAARTTAFSPRGRTGRGFLAGATALGLERARVSAAAGAQETAFGQDLATQELGLRGREVAAKETTAAAATAKAAAGKPVSLSDRIKALTGATYALNPNTGATIVRVGNVTIPTEVVPTFENYTARIGSSPTFLKDHAGKSEAERTKIAARLAKDALVEEGKVATGIKQSLEEQFEGALGK